MRRSLIVLAALALLLALAPAAAQAARGACIVGVPGARCNVWTGKVTSVNDGDTMDVDVAGDGTRRSRRIRLAGVQAMEQTSYSARRRQGDCHAVEATLRLEALVRQGRGIVRLAAADPYAMSRKRFVRSIAVKVGHRWRDVGGILVTEGLGLWWATSREWAPNASYSVASQRAKAAQRGLFDSDGCGAGPGAASPLKLWANWDADGNDTANPGGEWVKVRNLDLVNAVPVGGWYVRDSGLRRYTFPPAASIPPGGTVLVDVGSEGDDLTRFAWRLRYPVFDNVSRDARAMGDGAYLFDPLGNVRASMIYPCRYACADPNVGVVAIDAHGSGREWVTLTNRTAGPLDLQDYQLKSPPYNYDIGPGAVLQGGESMRVLVRGAREDDTPLLKHWGLARNILGNGGDVVRLVSYDDITLGCTAWGSKSC